MKEISGQKYYGKDEFRKELMLRIEQKATDMNVVSIIASLKSMPLFDVSGIPIGIRVYSFDDMPIISTAVNEHGFYFMNQKTND